MRYLKGSRVKRKVVDSKEWLKDPADTLADRAYMKRQMDARRRIERLEMIKELGNGYIQEVN
jgi:hypothetical protein